MEELSTDTPLEQEEPLAIDVPLEQNGQFNPCNHAYPYLIPINADSNLKTESECRIQYYMCTRCKTKIDKHTFLAIERKYKTKPPKTHIGETLNQYTLTEKARTQRSIANLKHGQKSKLLQQIINCDNCPARDVCDIIGTLTDEEKKSGCKDLRQSYIQILKQDPHRMFYKVFAELKFKTDLQNLKDGKEGLALSKESLKAFELLLKATKLQSDMELRKLMKAKAVNYKGKTFDDEVIYELD